MKFLVRSEHALVLVVNIVCLHTLFQLGDAGSIFNSVSCEASLLRLINYPFSTRKAEVDTWR